MQLSDTDRWKLQGIENKPLLWGLPLEQIEFCRICWDFFNSKTNKKCTVSKFKHEVRSW